MTERELNEVREIRSEIADLERKIEFIRGSLSNPVPLRDGMPQGRGLESRIEKLVVQITDLEAELSELKKRRELAIIKVTAGICAGNLSGKEASVMWRRYVKCMRFRDIGFELNYSDAHVFYLHRQGLKKLGASK